MDSLFKWEALRDVQRHTLEYREPINGKLCEVEIISGIKVQVFRADDGRFYFCHGLTFGGKDAPGGAVSPFSGKGVRLILANHYRLVGHESEAVPGDILVWEGLSDDTPHSAILTEVVLTPGTKSLDYGCKLRSKNGRLPEADMTLEQLAASEQGYGETYHVYRRQ